MTSAGVPDLVRDLLRPRAFEGGRSRPVSLRTTHASWVFLIGDDVWKVKRPVDFGFLDFRTLEARRIACEDEVRLNRRLAPCIYLGVAPIRASPDGLTIHGRGPGRGGGPIVDWAVHMRRLPDRASAAAMLARGILRPERLAGAAEKLAGFLAAARPTPALGAPEVLRLNVDENFAQVEPFVDDLLERSTFDDVRRFQLQALDAHRDRFAERVAQDRIREGHGDLRLEHLYFLPPPDGIVAIDCVEFNERFRCGDAAGDVAFLAMELEAARRPDLAAGFLARFAEASDDFGLYGVIDFYLSYRAWVRGKVAAFLASDPTADLGLRAHKREEARRHFGLARSFSGVPVDSPFVLAVGGIIGSGKTTVAEALGRALAVPVVGSDRVRKAVAGLGPTVRGGRELYTAEAIERNYEQLLHRARFVLESGRGVILDATFAERRWRQAAADLARAAGARFAHLETRCGDAVLRARLAARRAGPSLSDATDRQLEDARLRTQPFAGADPGPRFIVETSGEPAVAVADALGQLERAGLNPARARQAS